MNDKLNKTQGSINDRIKVLISALNISARAFSHSLQVSESTTRNYLDKGSKPSTDYIERIANQYSKVNLVWLITGQGEPFLAGAGETSEPRATYQKNISGPAQTGNKALYPTLSLDDCRKDLQAAHEKIALLTSQLADKERIIQLLEKSGK